LLNKIKEYRIEERYHESLKKEESSDYLSTPVSP